MTVLPFPANSAAPMSPTRRASPAVFSPPWLMSWRVTDTLPASARSEIESALPALRTACAPADPKTFAVAMAGDLVRWIVAYGIVPVPERGPAREAWITAIASDYRRDLADLPADLLAEAIRRTIATHKHRNLPTPAEIRGQVLGELARRRTALRQAEWALRWGRFEAAPVPRDQRPNPESVRETMRRFGVASLRDSAGVDPDGSASEGDT